MSALPIRGLGVGPETRCAHYDTVLDVVSFRFDCCDAYYPCFQCHHAVTDHEAIPWPRDRFDEPSVRCGVCEATFTVPGYLESEYRCPDCNAAFNPGCEAHAELYFEARKPETDLDGAES